MSLWSILSLAQYQIYNDDIPDDVAIASDRSIAMLYYYIGIKMFMLVLKNRIFDGLVLE